MERVTRSPRRRRARRLSPGTGSGTGVGIVAIRTASADARPQAYKPRVRKSLPGTWTDELILAALRDWFDTFGETPLSYEWSACSEEWMRKHPRWPATATVCRHFGTWARAVRAAGLPPARAIAPGHGLAMRVEAARRLSAQGLGSGEIGALLDVSPRTVRGYLRAGNCHDCGAVTVTGRRCHRCAGRRANPPHWTGADVIRAVRAWRKEEGSAPTSRDWTPTVDLTRKWAREYPRWPSYETVRTLFGSWGRGLEAAGLRSRQRRWDRSAILAALREFAAANGRPPASADLDRRAELPAPATVRAHLGSFRGALEAAGLRPTD